MFEPIDTEYLFAFLRHKQASDSQLLALLQIAEHVVREYKPNAKLLFTSDKQGNIVSAGIYDVPLLLNHLGQFKPLQQHAPQLLSKKVECKATHHATLRLKIELDLWFDASIRLANSDPVLGSMLYREVERAAAATASVYGQ